MATPRELRAKREAKNIKPVSVIEKVKAGGKAFADNWTAGAQRIIDTHNDLYKSYSSDQSLKDKALRTWKAGAVDVASAFDMIIGSPLVGVTSGVTHGGQGDGKPNSFIKGIGDIMNWGGEQFSKGFDTLLDEKQTESEKSTSKFVGGEGLVEGLSFGTLKVAKPLVKGIAKGVAKGVVKPLVKKVGDIRFNKVDVSKSIEEYSQKLKSQSNLVSDNINVPEKITQNLKDLANSIKNGISKKDLIKKAKEYGITPEYYIKKLDDITNANYLKSRGLGQTVVKLSTGLKPKFVQKVEKELMDAGYKNDPKFAKAEVVKIHGQSSVDKVENWMNNKIDANKNSNVKTIEHLLDLQEVKSKSGDATGFDSIRDRPKGEALAFLERNGLIKRTEGAGREQGLDRFDWTDKGISEIKNNGIEYERLNQHLDNGAFEYPTSKYIEIKDAVDNNTIFNKSMIDDMVNDLSDDLDMDYIDGAFFRNSVGEQIDFNKLSEKFQNLNNKYGTNFSTDDIKVGNIKDVETQFNQMRKNEYITVDRIKNPSKSINISSSIGATERVFKTLYSNIKNAGDNSELYKQLSKIKKGLNDARKTITRKFEGDKISIKAKMIAEATNAINKRMALIAKYEGINGIKREILQNIKIELNSGKYKGNVNKIIADVTTKKFWDNIKTPKQLESTIKTINEKIAVEHARGLVKEIKNKLKKDVITKSNGAYKSNVINVEQMLQLDTASRIFGKMKYGELDIKELEDLLNEIEDVRTKGKSIKLSNDKELTIDINKTIKSIEPDIQDVKGLADKTTDTYAGKTKDLMSSYDNSLLFAPRLIKKVFGKSKEAYRHFITEVSEKWNDFEKFENIWTKGLAENIGNYFQRDVKKIEEWGQFLYARRRLYQKDGSTYWAGLDRIMNDRTSSFFKKSDKYTGIEKPDFWSELPDDMWNKIRQTELAGTMLKYNEYQKITDIWDNFHKMTGKMINDTRINIDNKFVEPDDYYISFQAKRGPNAEITADLGSDNFYNSYISPASLKSVSKNLKKWEYVWDYNPVSSLYGNGRNARYYAFMQPVHKNLMSIYNGTSKKIKGLSVDEVNNFSKEGWTFKKGASEIEIDEVVEQDGVAKILYTNDAGEKLIADLDDITAHKGDGIGDRLSDEGRYRIKNYIDRVGRAGNMIGTTRDRLINKMANHFNRLPLMGSVSVILKQPLSLIDGGGKIGFNNLFKAEKDLWSNVGLSNLLDEIPSIKNRAGGDFLIRELSDKIDKNGKLGKIDSAYSKYTELAMSPIKLADQWTYKKIWLGSLRKNLIDRGYILPNENITEDIIKNLDADAIAYADDITNSITSTANPLMMPQIYDKTWSKAIFGIFTTQLNRIQMLTKDVPELWSNGSKKQAMILTASMLTANIAETAVTIGVGKFLYGIGASTWEGYDKDFIDQMLTADTLYRITLGQTFIGSKLDTLVTSPDLGLTPIEGGVIKVGKDIKKIADGIISEDDEGLTLENISKLFVDGFGGKILQQIHTKAFPKE